MRHLALIAAIPLLACGVAGTETGNPDAQVRVRLTAWSSDPEVASIPAPRALTTGVTVTRALLGVEEIRLVPALADGSCPGPGGDDDGIEIERAFVADLLDPRTLAPVVVARGDRFCGFRVDLEEGEDLPGGAALGEAEILVEGTRADGTPFVVRSDGVGSIRVFRDPPFSFAGDEALWFVAFDVARWFEGVDLDAATPAGGIVVISDDENEALLEAFEAAVEAGASSCDDDDDDDVFEDDCADDDGD